jgi:hypothetical protein
MCRRCREESLAAAGNRTPVIKYITSHYTMTFENRATMPLSAANVRYEPDIDKNQLMSVLATHNGRSSR